MRFNTALLHGDFRGDKATGATLTPIYQSSAFEHDSAVKLEKIFHNQAPGFSYTRISNPTVDAFEKRMTALEGGIASVACASGMAALYNAFCNILRAGDEIVSSASLYGGSIDLFRDLESFGITTRYVENNNLEEFRAATNEHTRLYFAETIGNPRLDVTDIEALAKLAHDNGVPLIMDNTVATAYLVQPLKLGADVVVNSTSKYINANSSAISGVITDAGRFKWDEDRYPGMKEFKKFGRFLFSYCFAIYSTNGLTTSTFLPSMPYIHESGSLRRKLETPLSSQNCMPGFFFRNCLLKYDSMLILNQLTT